MTRWWGIFFLLYPVFLAGQGQSWQDTLPGDPPRVLIRTDVLRWVSLLKPAANIGLDVAVSPHHRLDLSLGWHLGSGYFAEFNGESYRGPRLRLGWKWIGWIDRKTALFAGLEARYDRIKHREWAYVSRQGQQYVEIFLRHRQVESLGGAFRFGMQFYMGPTGRWVIEPEVLLGVARHQVSYRDPDDVSFVTNNEGWFDFRFPEGRSTWFYPVFSVNLGYVIRP